MNNENSPFRLENDSLYKRWRDKKLHDYPSSLDELIVEINDPKRLTSSEHQKLLNICAKANMVIYKSQMGADDDQNIPLMLGEQFGLKRLDHNMLSEKSGLSALTVDKAKGLRGYIPYSNRSLQWHTDGYYNTPDHQIHSILLHCVQSAQSGGDNQLLDHEIAYLLLRDKNPDFIKALMQKDVMTIPARMEDGKVARAEETGPVFSIDSDTGNLHMRFTIRKRHVIWKEDDLTTQARQALSEILNDSASPYIFNGRLESGMGLLCNNVLHDRTGFNDDENHRRILYRARYFDRVHETDVAMLG